MLCSTSLSNMHVWFNELRLHAFVEIIERIDLIGLLAKVFIALCYCIYRGGVRIATFAFCLAEFRFDRTKIN